MADNDMVEVNLATDFRDDDESRTLYEAGSNVMVPRAVADRLNAQTGGALAEDFPHAANLQAAGFDSVDSVAALSDEDLTAIDGIGRVGSRKIRDALGG